MSAIGSFGGAVTLTALPSLTSPSIQNSTIAVADTEQSYIFPVNTQTFLIRPRGGATLRIAFAAGTSGSDYLTVSPGAFYSQDNVAISPLTIYFQSPTAGLVVELISWA